MIRNYWYLVCPVNELTQNMAPRKILGEKIVFFRDQSGKAIALEDRCCHRNVQLSLGYLKKDNIVCGYHGWEYDGTGTCVRIPSQADDVKIPKTAQIKSYPLREFNRWVWIFMGDPGKADEVALPDIQEMNSWDFTYDSYVFKADLESAAESLIDPYHIAFVHRNSIQSFMGQITDFPADFNLEVVEDGLEGTYRRANVGKISEKVYFGKDPYINTFYRFYYPNISHLELRFRERTLLILENVYAVDDEHVMMMQITLWKNIFPKFPAFARMFMRRKSAKIVREDIAFLTSQKEIYDKTTGKRHEVTVKGDEISIAFRKYWKKKQEEAN